MVGRFVSFSSIFSDSLRKTGWAAEAGAAQEAAVEVVEVAVEVVEVAVVGGEAVPKSAS